MKFVDKERRMKEETKYIADLFVKNYHSLRKAFKWTDEIAKRMSAYLFAIEGKEVDIEAIKQSAS